jgi:hypothetical protein
MLAQCPECKGVVSDQAKTCPHCGHPLSAPAPSEAAVTPPPSAAPADRQRRAPVFMVASVFGLFVCLFTPQIILAIPVLATIAFGMVSIFRRERARVMSALVLAAAIGLLMLSAGPSGSEPPDLGSVEIVSSNWKADPSFGNRGTVRWNVEVKNTSQRYIESVRVEITTYDRDDRIVTSDFTFVSGIPPGESRSDQSFATYYGTEDRAAIRVTNVRFNHP